MRGVDGSECTLCRNKEGHKNPRFSGYPTGTQEIYHLRSRYPCGIRYIPERVDNGDESVNVDEGEGVDGEGVHYNNQIAVHLNESCLFWLDPAPAPVVLKVRI